MRPSRELKPRFPRDFCELTLKVPKRALTVPDAAAALPDAVGGVPPSAADEPSAADRAAGVVGLAEAGARVPRASPARARTSANGRIARTRTWGTGEVIGIAASTRGTGSLFRRERSSRSRSSGCREQDLRD